MFDTPPHLTNNVGRVYPEFFPSLTNIVQGRGGRTARNFEKDGLSYEGNQNYHKNLENCITVPRTFVQYCCYHAFQRPQLVPMALERPDTMIKGYAGMYVCPPGRLVTRIVRLPVYCLHSSKSSRLRRCHPRYRTYLMFCTGLH